MKTENLKKWWAGRMQKVTTTDADILLRMIERVDPSKDILLDEIDARAWCWFNKFQFISRWHYSDSGGPATPIGIWQNDDDFALIKYTRSRDALMSARPPGYYFDMVSRFGPHGLLGYVCPFVKAKDGWENCMGRHDVLRSPVLPTEELAELHSVIRATLISRAT